MAVRPVVKHWSCGGQAKVKMFTGSEWDGNSSISGTIENQTGWDGLSMCRGGRVVNLTKDDKDGAARQEDKRKTSEVMRRSATQDQNVAVFVLSISFCDF